MIPKFLKLVEVKTTGDLPKETMVIYGKYKNSITLEAIEFHKEDKTWGLVNLDWYYLPITEEELQNEICLYPKIK